MGKGKPKQQKTSRAPKGPKEPYWSPLPRQRFSTSQTAGIVARHIVPLAGVLLFGWSAGEFVLLSVFNIAFSMSCIGVVGVAVSTRKEVGPSPNLADAIGSWLMLVLVGLILSLVLTGLFGWVVALFVAWHMSIAWAALTMVIAAAPALFQQYQADMRSTLTEEDRKKRDQPQALVLALCAGLIFIMSGYVGVFGRYGQIVMAIAVTALFIFRDLRPDLMRELTRPKDRPPASDA